MASLSRWVQPDTLVPEPGNLQSLNRYAYVLNNPLKYTDPTGHVEDTWGDIGGGNPGAWAINPEGWHPLDPFRNPLEVSAAEDAQAQAAAESEVAVAAEAEAWQTVDQNIDIGGVVRSAEGRGGRWVQPTLEGFDVEGQTAENVEGADYWNKRVEFEGKRVYQRDDLIDPQRADKAGVTSLERMRNGYAAIGPDGEPIQIHHMVQVDNSPVAEVTETFHDEHYDQIHIYPRGDLGYRSGIDRPAFDAWREDYWRYRAWDFPEGW